MLIVSFFHRLWCRFVYYFVCFYFVNINKENRKDRFWQLYEGQMFWNLVDAFNSTQYNIMLKSYFFKSIFCLCFSDVNKWHQFIYILKKKTVKFYQYGYQMKRLDLRVKNLLLNDFVVFLCGTSRSRPLCYRVLKNLSRLNQRAV